jgi:hypothetical protein
MRARDDGRGWAAVAPAPAALTCAAALSRSLHCCTLPLDGIGKASSITVVLLQHSGGDRRRPGHDLVPVMGARPWVGTKDHHVPSLGEWLDVQMPGTARRQGWTDLVHHGERVHRPRAVDGHQGGGVRLPEDLRQVTGPEAGVDGHHHGADFGQDEERTQPLWPVGHPWGYPISSLHPQRDKSPGGAIDCRLQLGKTPALALKGQRFPGAPAPCSLIQEGPQCFFLLPVLHVLPLCAVAARPSDCLWRHGSPRRFP